MRRFLLLALACFSLGCERRPESAADSAAPPPATVSTPEPLLAEPPSSAASAPAADAAKPPPFVGTAGIVEKRKPSAKTAILSDVRAARHPGHDRIVFEFEGGLPGYHLEYVDKPVRRCGSGEPVKVAGDGWLRVAFEPSAAHDDAGRATIADRDRQRKIELGVLREMVLTCDFEAHVDWVLGVASPNRYRVLELDSPPRLVVDIRER